MGIVDQLRDGCPHGLIESHWTVDWEATEVMLNTAADIIERLKGYAVHDENCEDRGAYPGSCTCGLSRLLREVSSGGRDG